MTQKWRHNDNLLLSMESGPTLY